MEGVEHMLASLAPSGPVAGPVCAEANGSFAVGERFNRSCEETCVCAEGGRADCRPRCQLPLFRRGSRLLDAACYEKEAAQDPCCAVLFRTQ
ncbi:Uncharacterized protein GBIM_04618 [Gryllus bimaculatus]|nr:Uncharacterized protein GBIM_04618 [Gryllus bimaculatus]